jgi:hypothetical protein
MKNLVFGELKNHEINENVCQKEAIIALKKQHGKRSRM